MKKNMRLAFFVCLFFTICAPARATDGMKIQFWKTENNVPVYFVQRFEIPMIDMAVVYSAGSARDAAHPGLASLTAALLSEGTQHYSASDIAERFDAVGAAYSANATRDFSIVSLRTLSDSRYSEPAEALYLDVLSKPTFEQAAVRRVQAQIVDTINMGNQDPGVVANHAFYQALYGEHAYAHPTLGVEESVKNITPQNIQDFYKKYYVDHNAKIIIVGCLSRPFAEKLAQRIASVLAHGDPAPPIPAAEAVLLQDNREAIPTFIPMNVSQSSLFLGALGVDYTSRYYFDLLVANHIFGGEPLTSMLMQTVRDRYGYTYGVTSQFTRLLSRGPFVIALKTRTEKALLAEHVVLDMLKTYRNAGPTAEQVQKAKANINGNFVLDMASNSGIFGSVILVACANLPLDYLENYSASVNAVTAASARKAFFDTVDLSQLHTIVVGSSQN